MTDPFEDTQLFGTGDLARFLGGSEDSFTGHLLLLLQKADPGNVARIRKGFPAIVEAWETWNAMSPCPTPRQLREALTDALIKRTADGRLTMTGPVPVTDEMVERACASLWWNPELAGGPPYVARSRDYLLEYDRYTEEEKAPGGRREHDMEAYKAAEAEAYRLNREAMRKALEAALNGGGVDIMTMTTPADLDAGQCACWETCQNDAEPDSDMCAECLSEGCPGGRGEPDADR